MKASGMEYRGRAEEKEREGEIREEGKERGDKPKCRGGGARRIRRQQRKLELLNRTDVSAVVLFHFVYLQAVITEVCMHVGGAFQLMDGLSR